MTARHLDRLNTQLLSCRPPLVCRRNGTVVGAEDVGSAPVGPPPEGCHLLCDTPVLLSQTSGRGNRDFRIAVVKEDLDGSTFKLASASAELTTGRASCRRRDGSRAYHWRRHAAAAL